MVYVFSVRKSPLFILLLHQVLFSFLEYFFYNNQKYKYKCQNNVIKKRKRNSLSKNIKNKILVNISLSQVQDNFSTIEKNNCPKNKYCLLSEAISITTHRTPTKKLKNKEKTKSNNSKKWSIAMKNKNLKKKLGRYFQTNQK